jgi:lysozyme family protein
MASFDTSFARLSLHEGGYSNVVGDKGEETYRGIARHYWPTWSGWTIVDRLRPEPDFPVCLDKDAELGFLVFKFYRDNFWLYDGVISQELADKIFQIAVNINSPVAHKLLQRALGLDADGIFGLKTLSSVNFANSANLLKELGVRQAVYYAKVYANNTGDNEQFLLGWMRRAFS